MVTVSVYVCLSAYICLTRACVSLYLLGIVEYKRVFLYMMPINLKAFTIESFTLQKYKFFFFFFFWSLLYTADKACLAFL